MKRFLCLALLLFSACSTPTSGPDKTIAGAVLGAGWGAGAGAIVGNQIESYPRAGEGAAVGAGFGLVSGALQGAGYDQIESDQIRYEKDLEALSVQNLANGQSIANLQAKLDNTPTMIASSVYQVYFESDATNPKKGSIVNLEQIADQIRKNPRIVRVHVFGHTDDTGDEKYNLKLSEARAGSVVSYLLGRGISNHQIQSKALGAKQPVASNETSEGRQLNRRVDLFVELY